MTKIDTNIVDTKLPQRCANAEYIYTITAKAGSWDIVHKALIELIRDRAHTCLNLQSDLAKTPDENVSHRDFLERHIKEYKDEIYTALVTVNELEISNIKLPKCCENLIKEICEAHAARKPGDDPDFEGYNAYRYINFAPYGFQ